MSSFTRVTTPAFSANPLQTFVTYKQARRAAKGGGVVAIVVGGLLVWSVFLMLTTIDLRNPNRPVLTMGVAVALAFAFFILGWRIWLRPGPWKILPVLALVFLDAIAESLRFSVPNLILMAVTLNFTVIAYRGALSMQRFAPSAPVDIEVF